VKWTHKAKIMQACAVIPFGNHIYRRLKKTFGRLKAEPMSRLPFQIEMTRWILEKGLGVDGKRFFEVGTGHMPIVPIGFFLVRERRRLSLWIQMSGSIFA